MTAADATAFEPPAARPAALARTRPFTWSVRRELWENRAILIAPLIAAAVVLAGFLVSRVSPHAIHFNMSSGRGESGLPFVVPDYVPYMIATIVVVLTGFVVAAFYCLGALQNERRDRSILFWKSLPVSDLVTVLSKAFIPMVVTPVVIFAVVVATQVVMLALASVILLLQGQDVPALWAQVPLWRMSLVLLYGLVVLSLWHAPLWGWLLLVSGWARRMSFLWAAGPPLALCVFERLAFGTKHLSSLFGERLVGGWGEGFTIHRGGMQMTDLSDMDPVRFVASPGLWIGLVVGAALLAAAVWLRRRREPI